MSAVVVKLPTAARRQVRQPQNRKACAARLAFRENQSKQFPFRFPSQRVADLIASAIHPMTADRWLIVSILRVLDDEQLAKIAKGNEYSPTVAGLLRIAKGSVGLNMDVINALERLDQ